MGVTATVPRVIAATAAKSFDTLWLKSFAVQAADPNAPCRIVASVDLCRTLEGGRVELLGEPQTIVIDDFWAACQRDADLLQLMGAIVTKLKTIGNL